MNTFKYVSIVCCLKSRFYCVTFFAMSNFNSAGFTLELSNVDLLNIDLLDTHLDLLDTDIPSKYFAFLHNVFKTSSRHIFKTCSRRLQDMSSRRLEEVFSFLPFLVQYCTYTLHG